VIVHGLDQALAALAPGLPVTLLSAPAAACHAGVGWWRALVAEAEVRALRAQALQAGSAVPDLLDCGEAAGRALEALRLGQPRLILRPASPCFATIARRAALKGAVLLAEPPPALDLSHPGAARRLRGWLDGCA